MPQYTVNNFKQDVESIIEKICQEIEADLATFHLYDPNTDLLYFPMSFGLFEQAQFERGVPNMNRLPGEIARNREPAFIEDIDISSGLAGPFSYTEGVRSVSGLPIVYNSELLGVLFLNYRKPHSFSQIEQERLIDKAVEFAEVLNNRREQVDPDLLKPETLPSSSSQTRQEILLQEIVEAAAESVENTSIIVWLPDTNKLIGKFNVAVESDFSTQLILDKESEDPVAQAFRNQNPLYIEDIRSDNQYQLAKNLEEVQQALRWTSIIIEPIVSNYGQTLGVIAAYSRGFLNFNSSERSFLKAFANSAAIRLESERKIDSLNMLHDLGTRLTLPLSLSETLDEIVKAVPKILGADICTMHLYNAASQDFEDVSKAATFGARSEHLEKPRKSGVASSILQQGWIVVKNVEVIESENPEVQSTFVRAENVQSYVGINLQVLKEPVGVMYISYRTPREFTADDYTLMRAISYYAATAIYTARIFEQRDVFAEIAREITTASNRQDLLRIVLNRSLSLLGSEYGAIGLRDPETEEIKFEYAVGSDIDVVPPGMGLTRTAIETGKPVRVDDVREASLEPLYVDRGRDTVSEMDIPLLRGKQVIGVLNVETKRPAAYTQVHEDLAVALAAQTVIALDKIEVLNQRITDIQILREIYCALETEELEESLANVVTRAVELTGADYGGIYLFDRSAQNPELFLVALPQGRATEEQREERIPVEGSEGILPHVVKTGEVYRCEKVQVDPYYFSVHEDTCSELMVPLTFNNQIYGAIDLESRELGWFNEREEELVEAIAGAAASAVRQVHLFEDLEEVNRLSVRLNSTTFEKVQEVVELIYQSANKLMDTNYMYIALYDDYTDTVRFSLMYEEGERIDVEQDPRFQPRKGGQGITEAIIRTKAPIFHSTGTEHWAWYEAENISGYKEKMNPFFSWIGVPMIVDDKILGVVATYHPSMDHVYSLDDLTSLQAMANQAAIAISNVRLSQQRKLWEMGQLFSARIFLPESELLEILYQQAKELMNAKFIYIALYDQVTDIIRFGLATGPSGRIDVEQNQDWKPRRAKDGKGKTEWIVNNQKPLFHPTQQEAFNWYKEDGIEPSNKFLTAGSWIGVPMLSIQGTVIGVISVSDPDVEYKYNHYDLQLLKALAEAGANALENAHRYREASASQELGTLGTAMGAIQHRINNTLNIVSPNVERLRRRVDPEDGEIKEILDIIDRNVHYTSQIIHRIQEALRGELQTTNINSILQEVANQAEAQWRAEAGSSDIEVIMNLDDSIPLFTGSTGQITEVFTNLAYNACRVMPNGGKLNIVSKLDGTMISVRIIDAGPGISSKILSRLFARPVPSKDSGGTSGLGLYLGSLIIQSLGGSIKVEKTGANGTTMLVQFPLPRA